MTCNSSTSFSPELNQQHRSLPRPSVHPHWNRAQLCHVCWWCFQGAQTNSTVVQPSNPPTSIQSCAHAHALFSSSVLSQAKRGEGCMPMVRAASVNAVPTGQWQAHIQSSTLFIHFSLVLPTKLKPSSRNEEPCLSQDHSSVGERAVHSFFSFNLIQINTCVCQPLACLNILRWLISCLHIFKHFFNFTQCLDTCHQGNKLMHAAVYAAQNKVVVVQQLRKTDANSVINTIISGVRECLHEKNSYGLFFKSLPPEMILALHFH